MKLYSVYFDLDGVLVNSFGLHQKAWAEAFLSIGIEVNDQITNDLRSVPAITALRTICERLEIKISDKDLLKVGILKDRIRDREIEGLSRRDVFPCALDLLNQCQHLNIRAHCLATTRAANKIIDKMGIMKYFHSVTCGDNIEIPKRKSPATLMRLVKCEKVDFKNILYFDDSTEAVSLAMENGIPSILVNSKNIEFPSARWRIELLYKNALDILE